MKSYFNKPLFYIPFSFSFLLCIVYISLSVPTYSLIIHFIRIIYLSIFLALVSGISIYFSFRKKMDFENIYPLTALSLSVSFVFFLALLTFINNQYATKHCNFASYKVVGYEGRYTSGLGKLDKKKLKANQWILSIVKNEKVERFVLDNDISNENRVTKTLDLQFCKGLLGTEFLNLEQMSD